MESKAGKTISVIIIGIMLAIGGFWGALIAALSGGQKFYSPLIIGIALGLFIFVMIHTFEIVNRVTVRKWFMVFVGLCVISVGVYEAYSRYHASFGTVNEQGVNLYEYMPFKENTKAVSLDEQATLQIEGEVPRLDGATALYPLYAAFVQATYPEREYDVYRSEVTCTTTGEAYKRLMNGEADIIFVARPSKAQLEEAKQRGIELTLTPIGREAFVFFVNSRNDVKGLTTEQIQGIYSGQITNWQELGGRNESIRAFQRPENSGSQTMLQKIMEGKDLVEAPKEDVVAGMGGIISQTANYRNYRNAIGYSFLFFATEMIKNGEIQLLEIDGVYPNRDTIRSGEYPMAAEFYAVTAGTDNPNVPLLIDWILSPQGQQIIEKTGYTALKN